MLRSPSDLLQHRFEFIWIDAVRAMMTATDEAAETASSSLRERMYDAFARATQLEWIFWDSAFRLESWPV